MASINASTSGAGGVITTADNTGTLQLQSGGTTIATISSTGITTQVGAPAFSAYRNTNQSISTATWTKVQLANEVFDTNSNFDSSTNYRFTPTVAGYYQINGQVRIRGTTADNKLAAIYKNGSFYSIMDFYTISSTEYMSITVNALIYLNGSTDYVELYGFSNGSNTTIMGDSTYYTAFSGFLARSA
jgi:hypothetical protein